jgi:hypothetical protein
MTCIGRIARISSISLILALLCFPLVSSAQLFKCKQPNGHTEYQPTPCQDLNTQEVLKSNGHPDLRVRQNTENPNTVVDQPDVTPTSPLRSVRESENIAPADTLTATDSTSKSNDSAQIGPGKVALLLALMLLIFASWLWLLIAIARISVLGAVLSFFGWPITIYFLLRYWNDSENIKAPFFAHLISWILLIAIIASLGKPSYEKYVKEHREAQSHSSNMQPAR